MTCPFRLRRPIAALTLTGLALSLSGCGGLFAGPTAEVGECVQMETLQDPEIDEILTLECTEEHDGQVVHTFEMPAGDYPSNEEWQSAIRSGCTKGFEEYVGIAYDDSTLTLQDLSPTEEAWDADDRSVLCITYLEEETTTESFEGAKI